MKYEEGIKVLRFNKNTGKWYRDKPNKRNPWQMTVWILSQTSCPICGERFFYCSGNKGRFCSLGCATKYRNSLYGISKETAKKISDSKKGKKLPPEVKEKMSIAHRLNGRWKGSGNPSWKGGISLVKKGYHEPEYKDWRHKVFERDNYTCQLCGQKGGELQAHHIKTASKHRDLMLEVDNGITLCVKCQYCLQSLAKG